MVGSNYNFLCQKGGLGDQEITGGSRIAIHVRSTGRTNWKTFCGRKGICEPRVDNHDPPRTDKVAGKDRVTGISSAPGPSEGGPCHKGWTGKKNIKRPQKEYVQI